MDNFYFLLIVFYPILSLVGIFFIIEQIKEYQFVKKELENLKSEQLEKLNTSKERQHIDLTKIKL